MRSVWLLVGIVSLVGAYDSECNLRCWLRSMVVEAPPISFGVLTGVCFSSDFFEDLLSLRWFFIFSVYCVC